MAFFQKIFKKKQNPKKEERASIRNSDGIPFLPYDELKEKYPFHEKDMINQDKISNMYKINKEYIIRKLFSLADLIQELNASASNYHPCILRPVFWSVDYKFNGYLLLERGEDVRKTFQKQTTFAKKEKFIKRVMFDTMSAVDFLHGRGIVLGNISPDNMVYSQGLVKFRNLGTSFRAELNEDGKYYVKTINDDLEFRDIEFSPQQYNNINCEVYSLFMSYIAILEKKESPQLGELSTYQLNPQYSNLNWFFEKAGYLQEERPPLSEFLERFISSFATIGKDTEIKRHIGILFEENVEAPHEKELIADIMGKLVNLAYQRNIYAETLFLTLHLIHRTYAKINSAYPIDLIFGCAAMHIALIVNKEKIISIEEWREFFIEGKNSLFGEKKERKDFDVLFNSMVVEILTITKGIISTLTYWDYAKSRDDLIPLLRDTINWNYNNRFTRTMNTTSANKCIRVRDFLKERDFKTFKLSFKRPTPTSPHLGLEPCILDLTPNADFVLNAWDELAGAFFKSNSPEFINFVGALLHNRDGLDQLTLKTSLQIYKYLLDMIAKREKRKLVAFILDVICHFDLREWETVLKLKKNPFTVTDEDI